MYSLTGLLQSPCSTHCNLLSPPPTRKLLEVIQVPRTDTLTEIYDNQWLSNTQEINRKHSEWGNPLHRTLRICLEGDFPSGPVVKSLCFQCRGHRFNPWLRNSDPTCCVVQQKKKKRICLAINVLWQFQDLLREKYKILVREIKEVLKSWVLGSISSYEDTTQ